MTPNQAKKEISKLLEQYSLPAYKLTAKTVSFMDLARDERIVVTIHGWQPNILATAIKTFAPPNVLVDFA
jgi:hypothetical protein